MASYLSKVPEFGTYQPEVNAELYGKLLLKKEQDYQTGVQKVNKYLDYVSTLPVGSERDRVYLQQKVDGITSELNRDVNVDWSNQSVQKLTASHIKAISSDPNVQAAVQSASNIKRNASVLTDDKETSGGKNNLNEQDYLDKYNNWLQNGKLGEVFNEQYSTFLDPLDDFQKYYKDKKPNQKIVVKHAGYEYDENGNIKRDKNGKEIFNAKYATQQWDATSQKWEELDPKVVEDDFRNFISTNPQYQKQLSINAKYKYKSVGPEETLSMLNSEVRKNIEYKKESLAATDVELGIIPADSKKRPVLNDRKKQLESELKILEAEISPEAQMQKRNALESNPELVQSFREQLYQHDLSNTVMGRYSYRKEIDFNVYGLSPSQKDQNIFEKNYKAEMLKIAKDNSELNKKKEERLADAAAAKQKKEFDKDFNVYGGVTLPGSTDNLKRSDWELFEDNTNELAFKLDELKNTYIADNYSQRFPDKFTMNPYTYKLEPKPEFRKTLDDMYENLKQMYLNGEYLPKEDMNHYKDVVENEKLYNISTQRKNQAKEALKLQQEQYNTDPNYVKAKNEYTKEYSNYDAPYAQKVINATYVFDKLTKGYAEKGMTPQVSETGQKLAKQYGFKSFKEVEDIIYDDEHEKLISVYRDYKDRLDEKDNTFLSNYLKGANYIVNPKFIPLSNIDPRTGKKMTYEDMNNLVRPIVERGDGVITGKERSIGYVHDPMTNKFSIAIQLANDKMEFYEMQQDEVNSFRLKPMSTNDYLDKVLRLNTLPSGESSNTYSNDSVTSHTFMDAIPLSNVAGKEVRYHVKKVQGQYYVEFWTKDRNAPKDDRGYILINKKTNTPIGAQSSSLSDIKIAIKNFAESGSTAAPARYYTPSSDDETQQEEEE